MQVRKIFAQSLIWIVLLLSALIPASANAGCYDLPETRALASASAPGDTREVLVLVDQTISLPPLAQQHLRSEVAKLIKGGTKVGLGTFSAYTGSTFPVLDLAEYFETDVPKAKEGSLSIRGLRVLRSCLANSRAAGAKAILARLSTIVASSKPNIGQSDIMSSLKQFGNHLRSTRARDRLVILVSDMLENSTTTSFYDKGGVKEINVAAELAKAAKANLLGDLGGAKFYVIGAGLVQDNSKGAARSDAKMQLLEKFWSNYFSNSKSNLVAFGKPLLLQPIQ